MHVPEANRSQSSSGLLKLNLLRAQLRDMLAAEDSSVVTEENDYSGVPLPQRAEVHFCASSLGQN